MTYLRRRLCAPPAASNDHIAATLAKSRNKRLAINSRPRGMGVMLEWGQRRNCSGRGSGASFGRSAAALLSLRILPDGINRADDQDRRHGVDAHALSCTPSSRCRGGPAPHVHAAGGRAGCRVMVMEMTAPAIMLSTRPAQVLAHKVIRSGEHHDRSRGIFCVRLCPC